jgi:CRISPR-associated protein Csn2
MIHLISLNFEYLDEPLRIEHCTSLVIENRALFAKLVAHIHQYEGAADYVQLYDERYTNLKANELMVITDILGFDVNAPNVLKMIYHDLELQISQKPEQKTEIERLLHEVTKLVNEELLEFDIDLISDEITFLEVLKALGVQIEVQTDTIFERVFEIIQVFKYLSKKKLLLLINNGVYFSTAEMQAIAEYAKLQNISMLLLDPLKVSGLQSYYFLDNDYCVLREKMV